MKTQTVKTSSKKKNKSKKTNELKKADVACLYEVTIKYFTACLWQLAGGSHSRVTALHDEANSRRLRPLCSEGRPWGQQCIIMRLLHTSKPPTPPPWKLASVSAVLQSQQCHTLAHIYQRSSGIRLCIISPHLLALSYWATRPKARTFNTLDWSSVYWLHDDQMLMLQCFTSKKGRREGVWYNPTIIIVSWLESKQVT